LGAWRAWEGWRAWDVGGGMVWEDGKGCGSGVDWVDEDEESIKILNVKFNIKKHTFFRTLEVNET
jgi:hypothetical protein